MTREPGTESACARIITNNQFCYADGFRGALRFEFGAPDNLESSFWRFDGFD